MKKQRKNYLLKLFFSFSLVIGAFSAFPQQEFIVKAGWADGWADDQKEWASYGESGWTSTSDDVFKWSGTNVVANQSGDPSTNPLAIPQALSAESVSYNQMNKMADNKCLDLPKLVSEDVVYYGVYSPEQFRYAMVNQLNVKLMKDLDMSGQRGVSWSSVSFSKKMFIDGNGHTIYNLNGGNLVASWTQPLIVKDLAVSSASLLSNGGLFGSSNSDTYISMEGVSLEHAIVWNPSSFAGGLVNASYYRNAGSFARVYANRCHTKNVYVRGGACSGNVFGPISGWVENCYAIDGTMRTNAHSGAFTSCAGNYVIQNCFTNVKAYASNNTGAFVGHVEDSYYTPGGDHVSKFINCYASGSVEGDGTNLGGFCAGAGNCENVAVCQFLFENCYSTAMVGMLNNQPYQGGFLGNQEINAVSTIRNCYAAGEVGALSTTLAPGQKMGGFVGGKSGGEIHLENCYYDKQTTAMKEIGLGQGTANSGTQTGLLTQELMKTLPDGKSAEESAWVLADGTYPQLKTFANNSSFTGMDKSNADAYSKASVCTAILYPSNLSAENFAGVDKTDYDTVRSLRFLFPLTNNVLANTTDGSYDISWEDGGDKCKVEGMTDASIVVIKAEDAKNPADDYSVISLAPGTGYVTVSVKREGSIGKRRLRLIPTSAITVMQGNDENVSSGLDATIYSVPVGETVDKDNSISFLTFKEVTYDHRIGMFFASGNAQGENVQKQSLEGIEQNTVEDFKQVKLNEKPGGTVLTVVTKKAEDGSFKELEVTDHLLAMFTGKEEAEATDIGEYYFTYRWYLNSSNVGASSGYLETTKKLTVLPAVTVNFYRNYDAKDMTILSLSKDQIPSGQKKLYYKNKDMLSVTPNVPEREGYKLVGWSLNRSNVSARAIDSVGTITESTLIETEWADENYVISLYAIWEPNPHKIIITLPDGKEVEVDSAYDRDILEDLKDYIPEEEGKKFVGWTTDPDGTVKDIDDEDLMEDEDLKVYPVWEAEPTIKKEVENLTHTDKTMVKDRLRYTITIKNTEKHSIWKEVVVTDALPKGITYIEGSAKLFDEKGNSTVLNDSIYDKESHQIKLPIGNMAGEKEYILQFDALVGGDAIDRENPDQNNITNIASASGKNPDGSEKLPTDEHGVNPDGEDKDPGTSSAVPPGGEEVIPVSPIPFLTKIAENLSNDSGNSCVGDVVRYTINIANVQPGSLWHDVAVQDVIPVGIEIDVNSIRLIAPNGTEIQVSSAAYDKKTRMLGVAIGTIYGGETYKLVFDTKITKEALKADIGNAASAIGSRPIDREDEDWIKPEDPTPINPGDPYFPPKDEDGNELLPDGNQSTASFTMTEKSYPYPKDRLNADGSGGVLPEGTNIPVVNTGDESKSWLWTTLLSGFGLLWMVRRKRRLC